MMLKNICKYTLNVNVSGFLRNICEIKNGIIAKIQIISSESNQVEDVWIDCKISRNFADTFIWLQNKLSTSNNIVISLSGFYAGMYMYSSLGTDETSKQLTVMQINLHKLIEIYINGKEIPIEQHKKIKVL